MIAYLGYKTMMSHVQDIDSHRLLAKPPMYFRLLYGITTFTFYIYIYICIYRDMYTAHYIPMIFPHLMIPCPCRSCDFPVPCDQATTMNCLPAFLADLVRPRWVTCPGDPGDPGERITMGCRISMKHRQ